MTREEARQKLPEFLNSLIKKYEDSKQLPSDRDIAALADLFHQRDKYPGIDMESMAVSRGIIVGMVAFRQIIEGHYSGQNQLP